MLSMMAALAAFLCLLLAVAGLFKPALLGQKRRLNAFFTGMYGALILALIGPMLDGKSQPSGGFVLLAMLAFVHGVLLYFCHGLAVRKMSKDERVRMAAALRLGNAAKGVLLLFVVSAAGAFLTRPSADEANVESASLKPSTEIAAVQSNQQPADGLRELSLADQCQMELDIYQRMNDTTSGVMARFGGLLDGQQIDYHQIAGYRVSTVTPVISDVRNSMNGIRTSHLSDDVVIRLSADLVQSTDMFVGSLYTFARNGDAGALKSARDQLAQAVASHKQALAVCDGSQKG